MKSKMHGTVLLTYAKKEDVNSMSTDILDPQDCCQNTQGKAKLSARA